MKELMKKMIEVTVDKYDIEEVKNSEDDTVKFFGMGVPDKIQLFFTEELLNKMKKIQQLIVENGLTSIETLSSYKNNPDNSYAVFIKNNMPMELSKYSDFDRIFDTVDVNCFELTCSKMDSCNFKASFIYTSASCAELIVETKFFSIS